MALMATILDVSEQAICALLFLALLILLGMIGFAVVDAGKKRRNMTSSTATILGVVILSKGMASASASASGWCWSTASLIFCRGIAFAAAAAGRRDSESSLSSSSRRNYEVFLSFRGTDTRKGFTGHLYSQLIDAGIHVFKDDKNLRGGEEIKSQLIEVIKGSKISIAIFSKDYASSKSCLMEVVQMWECKISAEQTIIPIFYDISPYDVKSQAGDFATSFDQHKKVEDAETIKKWKNVLRMIGGLSGYNLAEINSGDESKLLKRVRRRVRQVLKKDDQVVTDKLVGIDLHVQEMMRKLGVVYSNGRAIDVCGQDVRVVGICGMPGVGKTTLAKVVFNKMHELFDECSFLEGINSKGVVPSQEILIADLQKEEPAPLKSSDKGIKVISSQFERMKVLIALDDVHGVEQLKALAGEVRWFGPGSRIIVTTDAINIVKDFYNGAVEEHKLTPLRQDRALQLFRKHAFQGYTSQKIRKYDSLSMDIVEALGGHPLAIVLWASSLRPGKKKIWIEALESFDGNQKDDVEAAFYASYQSLKDTTKDIFLDIACFFIGKDERIPFHMWQVCGYLPHRGIKELRDKHLLEDGENNELRMHNLLRDFGRKLVQAKDLHKRCRIWDHSEALKILQNRSGTGSVEGIGLTVEEGSTVCITYEETHQMSNLRYLRLDRAKIQGNTENLLSKLRWLDWRECHSIRELSNAHLEELVILDLSGSPIARDSKIWSRFEGDKLKVLNLQGCHRLVASLNVRAPINLEILILEDCTSLSEIGQFIKELKNLSSLNLRKCDLVKKLPQELRCMKSLRELLIDGTGIKEIQIESGSWKKLKKLSACGCIELKSISSIGHLTKLKSLALDGAKIDGLPDTFEFPRNLRRLSLGNCSMLEKLPPSIGDLGLVEVMDLSLTKIEELPPSVKQLRNLKTLKMGSTPLRKFPQDIVDLKKLEEIDFSGCTNLEGEVGCDISRLSSLRVLRLSSSIVAGLPENICGLSRLQTLDILECNRLQALPKLPSSLQSLRWGTNVMTIPKLSHLTNLNELLLEDARHEQPIGGLLNLPPKTQDIGSISRLPSLETLELSLPNVTNLPGNFGALTQLRELSLSYMEELDLTQLPSSSSLWTLRLKHCTIREPNFSSLKQLSKLELEDCDLANIDGLEDLKLLEVLKVFHCNRITNLNGLEELRRLRKVEGIFSARPTLPELDQHVELDICSGA